MVFDRLKSDFGVIVFENLSKFLSHLPRKSSLGCEGVDVKHFLSQSFVSSVDLINKTGQIPDSEGVKRDSKAHSYDGDDPFEVSLRVDVSIADSGESAECPVDRSQVEGGVVFAEHVVSRNPGIRLEAWELRCEVPQAPDQVDYYQRCAPEPYKSHELGVYLKEVADVLNSFLVLKNFENFEETHYSEQSIEFGEPGEPKQRIIWVALLLAGIHDSLDQASGDAGHDVQEHPGPCILQYHCCEAHLHFPVTSVVRAEAIDYHICEEHGVNRNVKYESECIISVQKWNLKRHESGGV